MDVSPSSHEESTSESAAEQPRARRQGVSFSVQRALDGLATDAKDAARLAEAVCNVHPDYIGERLGRVAPTLRDLDKGKSKSVDAWIAEVDALFHEGAAEVVDTKLLLFGLALLEGEVFRVLYDAGVIDPLVEELVLEKRPPRKSASRTKQARQPK